MSAKHSSWIPHTRSRIAIGLMLALVLLAIVGSLWSPLALVLVLPALAAGFVVAVLSRVRHQLSHHGGGWEGRIHQLVVSRLALPASTTSSLLDIGCGDGSLLIATLQQAPGVQATGIDFWAGHWDYAQASCETHLAQHGLSATFRRMDAARLEFTDASFDIVVSVMCFHEVHAPNGASRPGPLIAIAEALRVLRPGGTFVFADRFANAKEYGGAEALAEAFQSTSGLRCERLVALLDVPWPLRTKRALGDVEIRSGRKAAAAQPVQRNG